MMRIFLSIAILLWLSACATMALREPLQVSIAGLEPLPSEGLEARFLMKLRVQNPNQAALTYNGISVDLDLAGRDFAMGVTNTPGEIPGFGEAVIQVPVTVPVTAILYQVLGITQGKPIEGLQYHLRGRVGGVGVGGVSFDKEGEWRLPMPRQ